MGYWNYRLVVTAEDDEERDVEICEVYYDDAGIPNGYLGRAPGVTLIDGAVSLREELSVVLVMLKQALDHTVLNVVDGKLVDTEEVIT